MVEFKANGLQSKRIRELKKSTDTSNIDNLETLDTLLGSADVEKTAVTKGQKTGKFFKGVPAFLISSALVAGVVSSLLVAPAAVAAYGVNSGIAAWDQLPVDDLPLDNTLSQHTVLLDKNGNEFAKFFSENRINVTLDQVHPDFVKSLIATEDVRFYENNGFDLTGNIRSIVNNVSGGAKQGASGITQQLVKTIRINNAQTDEELAMITGRSYMEKLKELKYAVHVEETKTKEEILTLYLNTVFFGHGAYGIGAAAKTFFDTTPDKLTPAQIAVLVGSINSPTMFDPFTNPETAKERRNVVLGRMAIENVITQEEADKLAAEETVLKEGRFANGCSESPYPYYCQLVKEELLENVAFGATPEARQETVYKGGLTIKTALDPKAMDSAKAQVEAAYGNDNRVGTGVAVVVPGTGHIAAVAQNRVWGQGEGQTEVIYAKSARQVGSSFKPFTVATALEQGIPATTQIVSDSPYFPGPGFDKPEGGFSNYGLYDYGSVDAYQATKMSMNVYFVKLMERTGVLPVADMAKRLGINSLPREGDRAIGPQALSLTLGSYEVSPLEMANAYATFASSGIKCNAVSIVSAVRTETGEKVDVSNPDCHQAIMPNIADTMNQVLRKPFEEGGTTTKLALAGGRVAAAKTGTTNDWADGWVVGHTPQFATAVWAGDPRGGAAYPLTSYVQYGIYRAGGVVGDGSEVSGPIWRAVMNDIHSDLPKQDFTAPNNSMGTIVLARGIPDMKGLNVDEAMTTLIDNGFIPKVAEATEGDAKLVPSNVVVSQSPAPGTNGSTGQEVTLVLSPGSDTTIQAPKKKEK